MNEAGGLRPCWSCEITPASRLGWRLSFDYGISHVDGGPSWRPTRKWAERTARRFIAKQETLARKTERGRYTVWGDYDGE